MEVGNGSTQDLFPLHYGHYPIITGGKVFCGLFLAEFGGQKWNISVVQGGGTKFHQLGGG